MAKDFAKKFYNSKQWKECRKSFIATKLGLCERCQKPNSNLVHHKILLTEFNINDPAVTLDQKQLELHCKECHNQEHMSKYSAIEKGYSFNSDGYLVRTPPH